MIPNADESVRMPSVSLREPTRQVDGAKGHVESAIRSEDSRTIRVAEEHLPPPYQTERVRRWQHKDKDSRLGDTAVKDLLPSQHLPSTSLTDLRYILSVSDDIAARERELTAMQGC